MRIDKEMDDFLDGVVGCCEASSFEQHLLWKENVDRETPMSWEQVNPGLMPTIGTIKRRPVCLSMFIVIIDGYRILFYDACSQVVDHEMVRQWLRKALPKSAMRKDGFPNNADAMNFINVIHHLHWRDKEVDKVIS
jgi:hypothetical protein